MQREKGSYLAAPVLPRLELLPQFYNARAINTQLDELFLHWLSLPESQRLVLGLLEVLPRSRGSDFLNIMRVVGARGVGRGGPKTVLAVTVSRGAAAPPPQQDAKAGRPRAPAGVSGAAGAGLTAHGALGSPAGASAAGSGGAASPSLYGYAPHHAHTPPLSPQKASPGQPSPPLSPVTPTRRGGAPLPAAAAAAATAAEPDDSEPAAVAAAGAGWQQVVPQMASSAGGVIPQFYFPGRGRQRPSAGLGDSAADGAAAKVAAAFGPHPEGLKPAQLGSVLKEVCGLPSFLAPILHAKLAGSVDGALLTQAAFSQFWLPELARAPLARRLVEVLSGRGGAGGQAGERGPGAASAAVKGGGQQAGRYLTYADLRPMMSALLKLHPGLEFLADTPEFQERYAEVGGDRRRREGVGEEHVFYFYSYLIQQTTFPNPLLTLSSIQTVCYRILYHCNRAGDGRLSEAEISRSDLLAAMAQADAEEDINKARSHIATFFTRPLSHPELMWPQQ